MAVKRREMVTVIYIWVLVHFENSETTTLNKKKIFSQYQWLKELENPPKNRKLITLNSSSCESVISLCCKACN